MTELSTDLTVDTFVDLLNEDLSSEYQSIVQYIQHIAVLTGPEYLSTTEELKVHLQQEVEHAVALAEQINFLGGTTGTAVPPVVPATETRDALEADLQLETRQLERYRERVTQATELGLADVAEVLRPILTQTQDHVRDLQTALGE